ncbi:MAG: MGMT family protein [Candidatus Saccharibacteria bacterium]|nr:MGMT family protein [Candidatus Saccharibacteria bacterium]
MIYIDSLPFYLLSVKQPFGEFFLIVDHTNQVILTSFIEPKAKLIKLEEHPYINLVQQYFTGDVTALDKINIKIQGSHFQQTVLSAMRQIKFGQTISYGVLAHQANFPKASRAVGSVCRNNKLPLIIPCHRVIKSDGRIGQYAFGTDLKQQLLDFERSQLSNNPYLDF